MGIKEKVGIVVSNKMEDTCIVAVNNRFFHKKYEKVMTKTKRYRVHSAFVTPRSELRIKVALGATARIRETKPISKTKKWVLVSVAHTKHTLLN
jgi:small subunit ribosomal protein S17